MAESSVKPTDKELADRDRSPSRSKALQALQAFEDGKKKIESDILQIHRLHYDETFRVVFTGYDAPFLRRPLTPKERSRLPEPGPESYLSITVKGKNIHADNRGNRVILRNTIVPHHQFITIPYEYLVRIEPYESSAAAAKGGKRKTKRTKRTKRKTRRTNLYK